MFPLDYPLEVLNRNAGPGEVVLDPFCGRGTTLFAGRVLGLRAFGIDANPVAHAIAQAKISQTNHQNVVSLAKKALSSIEQVTVPEGEFWQLAYHSHTLHDVCKLREFLLQANDTPTSRMLRAIVLGALHGPLPSSTEDYSYLSNQMPRTFSSKPNYSVKFWRDRKMIPRKIDVISVIDKRARRFLTRDLSKPLGGSVILGDSQKYLNYRNIPKADWIITSPPYYGLTTYEADQWLRNWFLGRGPEPIYMSENGISHGSTKIFTEALSEVWRNCRRKSNDNAQLFIRFGSIGNRKADAAKILLDSLTKSDSWHLVSMTEAGNAGKGKRQAVQMRQGMPQPPSEFDFHARAK